MNSQSTLVFSARRALSEIASTVTGTSARVASGPIALAMMLALTAALASCRGPQGGPLGPTPTAIMLQGDGRREVVPQYTPSPTEAAGSEISTTSSDTLTPWRVQAATSATAAPGLSEAVAELAPASPVPAPVGEVMGVGTLPTLVLRAAPLAGGRVVTRVPGSRVLWAEAQSEDGQWLLVRFDESGEAAWLARQAARWFGESGELPVASGVANAPSEEGAKEAIIGRATVDRLNVRSGPGTDQPALGQVMSGQSVQVVGRSPNEEWLAIAWPGGQAWVAARFVEFGSGQAPTPGRAQGKPESSANSSGKLALQTRAGGSIYVLNADGTGLREIADGMDPALSPDGKRLALARWGTPNAIFVVDLSTGEERQVATAERPRSPTWNADGSRLAFSYTRRSFMCRVSPFGCLEEEKLRELLGGDCLQTFQGRLCIEDLPLQPFEENGLAHINLADGAWLDLPAQRIAQSPQYHPSSEEIIYRGDDGLQITAPDQSTRPLVRNVWLRSPSWSPGGERIVAQVRQHDHEDIVLLDAAGNVLKYLTMPVTAIGRAPNNVAPAWSPDGRSILFLTDRDGAWKLYRMNADGSAQAPLLEDALGEVSFGYDFASERVISLRP